MICLSCKDEKSVDEFGFDKRRKTGRNPYCLSCAADRIRNYRRTLLDNRPLSTKRCPKCSVDKGINEFHKNRHQSDGLKPWCKICDLQYKQTKYTSPGEREKYLLKTYNISMQRYEEMVADQKGKCLICETICERLYVDHDHECCHGKTSCGRCIRGLLCKWCNAGLGSFKDNMEYLNKAKEYIGMYNSRVGR